MSFRRTLNIKLITIFLLLISDQIVFAQGIGTTQSSPTQQVCGFKKFTLFSCSLDSAQIFALCLGKESLAPEFIWFGKDGHSKVFPALHMMQSVSNPSPHGTNVVTTSETRGGEVTFFLDTNPYDMLLPAISVRKNGQTITQFCRNESFNINTIVYHINGKDELLNIFRLNELKVSTPLVAIPEWPQND